MKNLILLALMLVSSVSLASEKCKISKIIIEKNVELDPQEIVEALTRKGYDVSEIEFNKPGNVYYSTSYNKSRFNSISISASKENRYIKQYGQCHIQVEQTNNPVKKAINWMSLKVQEADCDISSAIIRGVARARALANKTSYNYSYFKISHSWIEGEFSGFYKTISSAEVDGHKNLENEVFQEMTDRMDFCENQ